HRIVGTSSTGRRPPGRALIFAFQPARSTAGIAEDAPLYDDIVMDHIKNARNYRVLDDADRHLEGSNPMCGDEMSLYLKLDGRRIADLAFQCTCCGISMASASILTEKVKGASVDEARAAARGFVDMIENAATGPEVPREA